MPVFKTIYSPVKQLVNPAFINLDTRGGLGWLDGFNEWMVRCGIEWAGHPGLDDKRMLTLHGKVGNIPASEVRVVVEHGNPTTIRVRGRVDEKSMFGANLELWTEISTQVGSNTFAISDEVRNTGSSAQEFQIIYHANHGVDAVALRFFTVSATKEIRPLDGVADRAIDDYAAYKPPVAGFHEEVFGLLLYGDASNRTTVMLHNAAANKGVTMTYSLDELPYFNLWKNTGAAEDAYVTGLEPATGYPANRSIERAAGRVPQLQPGQSRRMSIEFALLDNAPAVAAATAQIEALAAGRPPRVNHDTIKPRQD